MPTTELPEWSVCVHSSGSEPGCAGCWYGTAMRSDAENKRLWALLEKGAKLLRTVYGSKDAFAYRAKEWLDEVVAQARAASESNRGDA